LQDEVVARLANSLGYELTKAEAQKSAHATDPDAIDLMMRGWSAIWQRPTKESTASAREYFERACGIVHLKVGDAFAQGGRPRRAAMGSIVGFWQRNEDRNPLYQLFDGEFQDGRTIEIGHGFVIDRYASSDQVVC
jgi:hypothetical protein